MNKVIISLTLFLIIISIVSCSLTDSDSEKFNFNVKILDSNGEPLEGIEIQIQNKLKPALESIPQTSASIAYSVAEDCKLDMVITDLDNQIIYSISDSLALPGLYTISPNLENLPNGEPILGDCNIFKCKFIAKSIDSGNIMYTESIYLCKYSNGNSIGSTDSMGNFKTSNKVYFPHLYNVPDMNQTDEKGNVTNQFNLENEVVITLIDSESGFLRRCTKEIKSGNNDFSLIFDTSGKYETSNIASDPIPSNKPSGWVVNSFEAIYINDYIELTWATPQEENYKHWNVHRGQSPVANEAELITSSIPAAGTTQELTEYSYIDSEIQLDTTYYYWLELVYANDDSDLFGPVHTTTTDEEIPPPPFEWFIKSFPNPFN